MAVETVQIKEVNDKGNGWFDVTLVDDDRVLSTKDTKLKELAEASKGGFAEVEVNTRTKGTFTNHYLQSINGEKESRDAKPIALRKLVASPGGGRSADTQERIARQWAFGRAVELLLSSDRSYDFPLDKETFDDLKLQAKALLDATK